MRDMTWYVYVKNFNGKRIEKFNIFNHAGFMNDVKDIYKKYKNDFNKFEEEIQMSLRYCYWAKCEWEIILQSWPQCDDFHEEKIDVYDQVSLNWDVFIKYVWDMCHARKQRKKKEENVTN